MKNKCIVIETTDYGDNYLVIVNRQPYFVVSKARASQVPLSYAVRLVKKELRYCEKLSLKRSYKILIT